MSHDIELQRPDGLDLKSVIHLRKSCADIARIIGKKMREAVVKIIVFKQNKVPVIIDESVNIIGKVVLVVRLRIAVGESGDP
jgi:molybdopterin-guanine dinucleotide biosynthesis protein